MKLQELNKKLIVSFPVMSHTDSNTGFVCLCVYISVCVKLMHRCMFSNYLASIIGKVSALGQKAAYEIKTTL
jgi:hypothetical protein